MKYPIGIDEVGRGPIAGPVAIGAFVFLDNKAKPYFKGVKESKQITEEKREEWFGIILKAKKEKLIDFAVVFQSEKIIDKKGISFAINKCIEQALNKINIETNIKPENCKVLLDGGLKAPREYIDQKTIIKGDEKEQIIALASICAKVLRDRKMKEWGKKYSKYGFEIHKGYGTKTHYEAIGKYGLLDIHRKSFLKLYIDIAKNGKIR